MIRDALIWLRENINEIAPFICASAVVLGFICFFGFAVHSCQQDLERMKPTREKKARDNAIHQKMRLREEQHLHIGHGCSLDPGRREL